MEARAQAERWEDHLTGAAGWGQVGYWKAGLLSGQLSPRRAAGKSQGGLAGSKAAGLCTECWAGRVHLARTGM